LPFRHTLEAALRIAPLMQPSGAIGLKIQAATTLRPQDEV
jgi:hypothetical protein